MLMAGASVSDRPNIHSQRAPGLRGPLGHADVLIQTRRFTPGGWRWPDGRYQT